MPYMTRRVALLGSICAFSGCGALSALDTATKPLDTYDLLPATVSKKGTRTSRTLLVARPQASAALTSDRIMVKPDPATITYLPDSRWSDEVPAVLQSLLIRTISGTGRIAYVGRSDAGPIPDKALLTRVDTFEVNVLPDTTFEARIGLELTIINDRDQRIVATRQFSQARPVENDEVKSIVKAFQEMLDEVLPSITEWVVRHV